MNKHLTEIRMKHNIGACLMISNVKIAKPVIVVEHFESNCQQKAENIHDKIVGLNHKLEVFIEKKTSASRDFTLTFPEYSKKQALERLQEAINKLDTRGYMIIVSGEGIQDTNGMIKLILHDDQKKDDIYLTFQDLMNIWDSRKNKISNRHLLLILDFCYSGAWVDYLAELDRHDIMIQASCKASEQSFDFIFSEKVIKANWPYMNSRPEGIFLNNFLSANQAFGVQSVQSSEAKLLGKKFDYTQLQKPFFFGNSQFLYKFFGVSVGFNSWAELETNVSPNSDNRFYIGQIDEVLNKITNKRELTMHGIGSIWKDSSTCLDFGEFSKGKLISEFNGELLSGKNSSPGSNSFKIDSLGNVIYGSFKNGYLEGKGIFATKNHGSWQGNFVKGRLIGKSRYTNLKGWVFHGIQEGDSFTQIDKMTNPNKQNMTFNFKSDSMNGCGLAVDEFCNIYEGAFESGMLNGDASFQNNFGYTITGMFENDSLLKLKEVRDRHNNRISAFLIGNSSEGLGVWVDDNCDIFFGSMLDGLLTGFGVVKFKSGDSYEGEFEHGCFNGKGKYTYLSGEHYEGNFVQNLFCGIGNFTLFNGDHYAGQFKDDLFHGEGKLTHPNGRHYEGNFENGEKRGFGRTFFSSGHYYEGEFFSGCSNGKGTLTLANGNLYTGDFSNGFCHGVGKLMYANGNVYHGQFVKGNCEGDGKILFASGDIYEGQVKKGQSDGSGILTLINGDKYSGKFQNGIFNGFGEYKFDSQNVYNGYFKDGSFSGRGRLRSKDGNIYEGDFRDGLKDGKGKLSHSNGARYEGQFKNGMKEGDGIYFFPNGSVYEGQFKLDKFDGSGKLTNPKTGESYCGHFRKGLKDGIGKEVFSNGNIFDGHFRHDCFNGRGTLFLQSGEVISGVWNNGKIVSSDTP